jgi:hypothetical protein
MGEGTPTADRKVTVGDVEYVVGRFRGYKATRIAGEVAKIVRRYPKIGKDLAAFRREYAEENVIELKRTEAEWRLGAEAQRISDKAWETSGGTLRLRQAPTPQEQLMHVFPDVFEIAEKAVGRILALLVVENDELEEAYDSDSVDQVLDDLAKRLLFGGDAAELLELAVAGEEVARGQFEPLKDKAGKLLAQIGLRQETPTPDSEPSSNEPSESESKSSPATREQESEASSTSSTSSPTSPSSSTDSPTPTDGSPGSPSSESPGEPSAVSQPA